MGGWALKCVIPFDYILCSVFRAFHHAFVSLIGIVASLGELFLCHLLSRCFRTLPPRLHAILRAFLALLASLFDPLRLAALLGGLIASDGRFRLPVSGVDSFIFGLAVLGLTI